jgi:hypothetical protein
MFPRPWRWRFSAIADACYGLWFLFVAIVTPSGRLLVEGKSRTLLQGEVLLADDKLPRRALGNLVRLRPFAIVRAGSKSPVESLCRRLGLTLSHSLEVYLSINTVQILFAEREAEPVVLHIGSTDAAREALRRHREGLRVAASAMLQAGWGVFVPEERGFQKLGPFEMLMQTRVPGQTLLLTDEETFDRTVTAALQPLLALWQSARLDESAPDVDLIHGQFPKLVSFCPELADSVGDVLPAVTRTQAGMGHSVPTHGDYWLNNVLFVMTPMCVSGIVDWERSRTHGTPGLDAVHLALMSLSMRNDCDILEYLEQIWRWRFDSEWLASYLERVRVAFDLDIAGMGYLAAFLYLDELHKLRSVGRTPTPSRIARFREVEPALREWLAVGAVEEQLVSVP